MENLFNISILDFIHRQLIGIGKSKTQYKTREKNMHGVTSLMNFECQPYRIFEGLSYHQEDKSIDTTIFAATVELGDIIKKLSTSNFMIMVSSVSVIFDTGAT